VIPEAHNAKSTAPQFLCAPCICRCRGEVLPAIELDDEHSRQAHEVNDIGLDDVLATKLAPVELP
jgi:hypothetical protein